jgi:DNA-binding transcriptional MerR regulator
MDADPEEAHGAMRIPRRAAAPVVRALRRQKMPLDEIRAILNAHDPDIVGRYLELHAERLDEWVAEQRRVLVSLERSITEAIVARSRVAQPPCHASHERPPSRPMANRRRGESHLAKFLNVL